MTEYVLLYSGGKMPEGEAAQKAVVDAWTGWFRVLGDRLVNQGNPFLPMVKSITHQGMVSNGPVGSMVSGFSIIKANSLDEATTLAKGCPVLKDGADISIYETFNPMP
jgi:hypothetical protein